MLQRHRYPRLDGSFFKQGLLCFGELPVGFSSPLAGPHACSRITAATYHTCSQLCCPRSTTGALFRRSQLASSSAVGSRSAFWAFIATVATRPSIHRSGQLTSLGSHKLQSSHGRYRRSVLPPAATVPQAPNTLCSAPIPRLNCRLARKPTTLPTIIMGLHRLACVDPLIPLCWITS